MKGSAQPYFTHAYTSQDAIFICEGVKDAWVIWQNLKDFNLLDKILVCTSTHGSAIPDAMKMKVFGLDLKLYILHMITIVLVMLWLKNLCHLLVVMHSA